MFNLLKCKVHYNIHARGRSHELCAGDPNNEYEKFEEVDEAVMQERLKPLVDLLASAIRNAKSAEEGGATDDKIVDKTD